MLYWFCHTSTWIHHGCTRVPHPEPPSLYHPSGSSQCTSPKHPVSCIEPGLAIHFLYDIIHASMPFSQIIPRSLSHRVQKTVLYICVSFAVLYHLSHQGSSYCNYQSDVLLVVPSLVAGKPRKSSTDLVNINEF